MWHGCVEEEAWVLDEWNYIQTQTTQTSGSKLGGLLEKTLAIKSKQPDVNLVNGVQNPRL